MTDPTEPEQVTMEAVYEFAADDVAAPGGHDTAEDAIRLRIRNACREAGEEPTGKVGIVWSGFNPDDPARTAVPGRLWACAIVNVRFPLSNPR